jgi:DNA helicase IV
MPKVGKKHYPYTRAGRRAAKAAAKKKGKKVRYTENTYERMAELMFENLKIQLTSDEVYQRARKQGQSHEQAVRQAEQFKTFAMDNKRNNQKSKK